MPNYKTTISGLITALAGFIVMSPELFAKWPAVLAIAKYLMAGGFAALGLMSKDFNQHSTAAQVISASVAAQDGAAPPAANPTRPQEGQNQ